MPKAPSSTKGRKSKGSGPFKPIDPKGIRQQSLAQELREDQLRSKFGVVTAPGKRQKVKGKGRANEDDEDAAASGDEAGESAGRVTGGQRFGSNDGRAQQRKGFVDPKLSRNILRLAQEQQQEIEEEEEAERTGVDPKLKARMAESAQQQRPSRAGFKNRNMDDSDFDDEEDDDVEEDDGELNEQEALSGDEDLEEEYEELEIDPEDRRIMEEMEAQEKRSGGGPTIRFGGEHADLEDALPSGGGGGRTLADIIMAKLEEAEAAGASGGIGSGQERPMPPGSTPR